MKKLAKLLSLILALALVFALVGCESNNDDDDDDNSKPSSSTSSEKDDKDDDDDDDKTTVSKVEADEDSIVGDWEGTMYIVDDEIDLEARVGIYITFYSNGDYVMQPDVEDFVDYIIEETMGYYEAAGEDFDEYLEENGYSSLDEFRDEGLEEMDGYEVEGTYEFDGDTFILDDEEVDFEFDGDEFIFETEGGTVKVERA